MQEIIKKDLSSKSQLNTQDNKSNLLYNVVIPNNKHKKLLYPSVQEWPNNLYNFNKNHIESSYHKSEIINKIIRNYFNLVMINKNSKNSKRMRDLIRRSSTKKLFVSKPGIKHNADKIIYTMYVFNKEKNFFTKKIYLLNKSLAKFNKYKLYNIQYLNNINNKLQLNNVRPLNRIGTINSLNNKPILNKSYVYKSLRNNFSNGLYLNKITKGLVHYINSNNKKLVISLKKDIKKNLPLYTDDSDTPIFNYSSRSNQMQPIGKKNTYFFYRYFKYRTWRNLFKNKNNNYFSDKLLNLLSLSLKKKQTKIFKSIFFYNFAKWVLFIFKIKILIKKNKLIIIKKTKSHFFKHKNISDNYIKYYNNIIGVYLLPFKPLKNIKFNNELEIMKPLTESSKLKKYNKIKLYKLNKKLRMNSINRGLRVKSYRKFKILRIIKLRIINKKKINKLNFINKILFKLLLLVLRKGINFRGSQSKTQNKKNEWNKSLTISTSIKYLNFLFKNFKNKYLLDALKNISMKQLLGMYYLYKNSIDNYKYNKFLITLKMNLLKIYNKKPQVNIINLKYLHLNSDMLLEAITIKLKNKKAKLLKTLKKAFKLIKLPRNKKQESLNNLTYDNIIWEKPKSDIKLQDIINVTLNKMYCFSSINKKDIIQNKEILNKETNDLICFDSTNKLLKNLYKTKINKFNNLKHKWITGIKIEGKGRLTRRYRADRSLFKLKHKGSLKNINFKDIYNKKHLSLKKTQSMFILKGQTTPNIQYSFSKWKRHIGSYGIKGWISSN